ncbi:eukaryotic translation initiation factor 3 subunit 7 (EIF-3) [Medicago truncatula]|uniref:Eukaryotic translation initiation factor 3 subunit 7 (EIF-3) n=1 Tax=Medicago truncatula TaxID=3880 RepID=G7IPU8_MEDTR|nr:eukaryotic translation initiation factor 3 subunit 7 (EIF-3) [Medicago truncatula]
MNIFQIEIFWDSKLDMLSVHETPQELLPEVVLSIEAGNPFANEGDEVAFVAYRYRRWKLDNDMYLVKLETQRGAELKNNANKLAKGTAQALLNFEHY